MTKIVDLRVLVTPEDKRLARKREEIVQTTKTLDDIVETNPNWLCKNVLAGGCMTMLAADPGCGKTLFAASLSAWLTRKGLGVVYMSPEVNWGMQLKGQFLAQNGDPSLMKINDTQRQFSDFRHFYGIMSDLNCKVMVLDTLIDYSGGANTWTDYEVGNMLLPLRHAVLEEHDMSVLVIHHTNKTKSDKGVDRISGSKQLAAQFHQVIELTRTPDTQDITAEVTKSNISEPGLTLECQIDPLGDKAVMAWSDGSPEHWRAPFRAQPEKDEPTADDKRRKWNQ